MKAVIYLEGGGDAKDLKIRCREGFRKLLENSGFRNKMPRLVASGSRGSAYDDLKSSMLSRKADYIAMLIDSEDPVDDRERTWRHLKKRDNWDKPEGAEDCQVLLMTTCMETWIMADRDTLKSHYGANLQESALPSLHELEKRHRHDIQDSLEKATGKCKNSYRKGKRSYEVLGKLSPAALNSLPSFQRTIRVLKEVL